MNHTSVFTWRTVDIIVAGVIAVAFGVVFQLANGLWDATKAAFLFYPPAQASLYGLWLVPAVLASLIIRKAGAGVFTETVAAAVSALLGSPYGVLAIGYGLVEGAGAELAFALGRYRRFGVVTAVCSGLLGGAAATGMDLALYYSYTGFNAVNYVLSGALSCAIVAGLGSMLLTKALASTGVLDPFPSGRKRVEV